MGAVLQCRLQQGRDDVAASSDRIQSLDRQGAWELFSNAGFSRAGLKEQPAVIKSGRRPRRVHGTYTSMQASAGQGRSSSSGPTSSDRMRSLTRKGAWALFSNAGFSRAGV